MNIAARQSKLTEILEYPETVTVTENYLQLGMHAQSSAQAQTNEAFSEKWTGYSKAESENQEKLFANGRAWYLQLYGFKTEATLAEFLKDKHTIYDAGCGIGYKAAWLATLAPHALVVGVDFSEAAEVAANTYQHIPNLTFIRGDIGKPIFKADSIDYVSCDQVIMHTTNPEETFAELCRATKVGGEFSCYFYAKKALVRELVDDYFRTQCNNMSMEELQAMSAQLTELGKRLSELNAEIDVPAIPALGIKAGKMDVQRFIYWNFLKCYWNAELGRENSDLINFDWYSPSNATRYHKHELETLIAKNHMHTVHFHAEEACYTMRIRKP
jgi:ubiquinone/menaquinone biosynthesis C-methylase UbiE